MRVCVPLVFCVVMSFIIPMRSAQATLPPTLRLSVYAGPDVHAADFEHALSERMAVWASWSIQPGLPLENIPCNAQDPRAGLVIHMPAVAAHVQTADVALVDCAAWPVEQWSFSAPEGSDGLRDLAAQAIFAIRLWQHHEPARFAALFDTGDAAVRDGQCRSELSLIKTGDGALRAIVRAGGPAYQAGLRSNDIIEQIDGRDWWEYGTYRSQQRAVDGRSHVYVLAGSQYEHHVACVVPEG